jgi:hypothetical protein
MYENTAKVMPSTKDGVPLVGVPSGEYIEIPFKLFDMLHASDTIRWDGKLDSFIFDDADYKNIMYYISTTTPRQQKPISQRNEDPRRKIARFMEEVANTRRYKINDDLTIDVYDDVTIREPMNHLPFKFGWIGGDFNISSCGLISLRGCPDDIEQDFICTNNRITDLKYGPTEVGGNYDVRQSGLYKLDGAPRIIHKDFDCSYNNIDDLKGGPLEIDGSYYAANGTMTSIEGAPDIIGANFDVSYNFLTDLYEGPLIVNGLYDCSNNDLRTLEGGPKRVGTFKCNGNPKLKNLDHMPNYDKLIKDEI